MYVYVYVCMYVCSLEEVYLCVISKRERERERERAWVVAALYADECVLYADECVLYVTNVYYMLMNMQHAALCNYVYIRTHTHVQTDKAALCSVSRQLSMQRTKCAVHSCYTCTYIYIYMYMYIYICMYIYIHTHKHMYKQTKQPCAQCPGSSQCSGRRTQCASATHA